MKEIQESGEMYLEAIHVLSLEKPSVRSIDVAGYLNYSKPSVSRAMGILRERGYITVNENGSIILTKEGSQVAKKIYERHTVLSEYLEKLGVDKKTAADDACRIEHVISQKSFNAIKKHILTLK